MLVAGDHGIRGEVVEKRSLEKDQDQEIVTYLFVSSVLTKSGNSVKNIWCDNMCSSVLNKTQYLRLRLYDSDFIALIAFWVLSVSHLTCKYL